MATWNGLEPSTSAVTGRRSNQLSHRAISYLLLNKKLDSNVYQKPLSHNYLTTINTQLNNISKIILD